MAQKMVPQIAVEISAATTSRDAALIRITEFGMLFPHDAPAFGSYVCYVITLSLARKEAHDLEERRRQKHRRPNSLDFGVIGSVTEVQNDRRDRFEEILWMARGPKPGEALHLAGRREPPHFHRGER